MNERAQPNDYVMGCSDSIVMESPKNLSKFNSLIGLIFDRGIFVFGNECVQSVTAQIVRIFPQKSTEQSTPFIHMNFAKQHFFPFLFQSIPIQLNP